MNSLENDCLLKADQLLKKGYVKDVDLFQLTDTLIALELEKREKNEKSDQLLEFNDEIVEIEDVGEVMTTDISTSGDNLFYCNGILTKNSFGLPATCDLLLAFISTEELEKANQYLVKQLKNRYSDKANNKRFIVGVDRPKMRLYDVSDPTANIVNDSAAASPVTSTPFSRGGNNQRGKSFNDFKV
jgi:hypothetical protein